MSGPRFTVAHAALFLAGVALVFAARRSRLAAALTPLAGWLAVTAPERPPVEPVVAARPRAVVPPGATIH